MPETTTRPATPVIAATALLERLEAAWNHADGAAFGSAFTDDADFVDIRGDHHRGRDAIAAGHQGIFASIYAGSHVRYLLLSARQVAPGAVVAVVASTLQAPVGPLQGTHEARSTMVLAEQHEGWSIASFHNTLVVDDPARS